MKWSSKNIVICIGVIVISAVVVYISNVRGSSVKNITEFNCWLNDVNHGCIKSREINGVRVTVKYLPPNYQVLKEMESGGDIKGEAKADNLKLRQQKVLTFLMTIGPTENKEKRKGVMYEGVEGYGDYVQRVMSANFYMDHYLKLYIDGVLYKPALSLVENIYELSQDRNFIVVFAAGSNEQLKKGKEFLFVYDDPFFNMGKLQFDFSGNQLRDAGTVKVIRTD